MRTVEIREGVAMDQSIETDQISAGDDVITADGESIGTVAAVHQSYLLVEKGLFFLTDYHIPLSAIDRYDANEGKIYLTMTRDEASDAGWEQHAEDAETGNVRTLLTGAASTPDTGDVLAVVEPDEEPLQQKEAEID
jgi:hypothetical protein